MLREKYHADCGISRHDSVNRPLIEMTGYIKWLETEHTKLIKETARIGHEAMIDREKFININGQYSRLDVKYKRLNKGVDELEKQLDEAIRFLQQGVNEDAWNVDAIKTLISEVEDGTG